jgi:hypothetical protein
MCRCRRQILQAWSAFSGYLAGLPRLVRKTARKCAQICLPAARTAVQSGATRMPPTGLRPASRPRADPRQRRHAGRGGWCRRRPRPGRPQEETAQSGEPQGGHARSGHTPSVGRVYLRPALCLPLQRRDIAVAPVPRPLLQFTAQRGRPDWRTPQADSFSADLRTRVGADQRRGTCHLRESFDSPRHSTVPGSAANIPPPIPGGGS